MAVIRVTDTQLHGGEHLAALGLLCGIVCSVLALKFKGFSAIFNVQASGEAVETPAVVSAGVYRPYSTTTDERHENGSTSTGVHKSINPMMVQLPPPIAQPSNSKEPNSSSKKPNSSSKSEFAPPPPLPASPPPVVVREDTVSYDPKGGAVDRVKSTDLKITGKENDKKLSKKEQQEKDKAEKKRIQEQKKKDKILIAEILKEDAERITREAKLLQQKQKEKAQVGKSKDKTKPVAKSKTEDKSKPTFQKATNPLTQGNPATSSNTLKSDISTNSGPPPYSTTDRHKAAQETTPSESDSSGNTSFGKPAENMGGTWDMVTQHRQQIKRPANAPLTKLKVDNTRYNVGGSGTQSGIKIEPPRKSLYV